MNLEFFVRNRKLTRKGCGTLVADTTACDTFTIDFDREWDELVKIVVLRNGSDTVQLIYTGKTPLPRQVCGRGDLYLTCHGYRQKGDAVAVVRTIPMVHPVRMVGSTSDQGGASQPVAPSVYEQMAALVEKAQSAAQAAETERKLLQQLRLSGQLVGPAGPAGQAATITLAPSQLGSEARVENLGTRNNAVLRFTLPQGLTEEEKEAMEGRIRQAALEDLSAALDEILAIQAALIGGEST